MIMLKAFFVFFISGLDVRPVISYYDDFFSFFLPFAGMWTAF